MQLIVNDRFVENQWVDAESFNIHPDKPTVVQYNDQLNYNAVGCVFPEHAGLVVENTVEAESLIEFFDVIRLLVIEFPTQMDGRGYSLAESLRRLGYAHELRARGELIADHYHHLRACGFDSIEISHEIAERHTEIEWRKAWMRFPLRYQSHVTGLSSILERRHSRLHQFSVN